jgi:hypothetical protein
MIIIAMRGENFVAHLDGLGGTPVAHHWYNALLHRWVGHILKITQCNFQGWYATETMRKSSFLHFHSLTISFCGKIREDQKDASCSMHGREKKCV